MSDDIKETAGSQEPAKMDQAQDRKQDRKKTNLVELVKSVGGKDVRILANPSDVEGLLTDPRIRRT